VKLLGTKTNKKSNAEISVKEMKPDHYTISLNLDSNLVALKTSLPINNNALGTVCVAHKLATDQYFLSMSHSMETFLTSDQDENSILSSFSYANRIM
jgi:hypothetical protein